MSPKPQNTQLQATPSQASNLLKENQYVTTIFDTYSPWTFRRHPRLNKRMYSPDHQADLVKFGQRLRELRIAKGFSQEALALSSGLDRSYVGGVERGQRNVSLINILKLATALNINPQELFS